MFDIVIQQFAKAPVLGKVKTRLLSEYTPEEALRIHCALVENCLTNLSMPVNSFDDIDVHYELWCSEPQPYFDRLGAECDVSLRWQSDGDLGKRLAFSASQALATYSAVILVGSDCPYLTVQHLKKVITVLRQRSTDAVIIPAEDGGYVLLALKQFTPEIFQYVEWGSDKVLSQTLYKFLQCEMNCTVLDPLEDIDRPEDYRKLCQQRPEFSLDNLYSKALLKG